MRRLHRDKGFLLTIGGLEVLVDYLVSGAVIATGGAVAMATRRAAAIVVRRVRCQNFAALEGLSERSWVAAAGPAAWPWS
jgi:hypothetical protein